MRSTAPPLTAEEAREAAEKEGLQLVPAPGSKTGFKGVSRGGKSAKKPFQAVRGNKSLGYFATAEEAALAYARHIGAESSAKAAARVAPRPVMTGEEAAQAAEAEGLTLAKAEGTKTGFKGVNTLPDRPNPRFYARAGAVNLGCFETAEQAALEIARYLSLIHI